MGGGYGVGGRGAGDACKQVPGPRLKCTYQHIVISSSNIQNTVNLQEGNQTLPCSMLEHSNPIPYKPW